MFKRKILQLNKYTLILILAAFLNPVMAQDSTDKSSSKIKKASIGIGTVIKKEFVEIYKYNGGKGLFTEFGPIKVTVLNITDAASGSIISGIRLEIGYASENSAFIDFDEIPGLLKFVDLLNKLDSEKPTNYTEYIYNCRDLELYSFINLVQNKNNSSNWSYGITLDKYKFNSTNRTSVELKVLNEIKAAINNNLDKFKQLN